MDYIYHLMKKNSMNILGFNIKKMTISEDFKKRLLDEGIMP